MLPPHPGDDGDWSLAVNTHYLTDKWLLVNYTCESHGMENCFSRNRVTFNQRTHHVPHLFPGLRVHWILHKLKDWPLAIWPASGKQRWWWHGPTLWQKPGNKGWQRKPSSGNTYCSLFLARMHKHHRGLVTRPHWNLPLQLLPASIISFTRSS